MTIRLVANPASGRGAGARALPAARAAFAAVGVNDVRLTAAAGDEERQVREALADGVTTLAVLGGDGTWSKVAGAVAAAGAGGACRLALLGAGTGNDFVKSLGTPARDFPAMARLAVDGPDRRVDLGRVNGRSFLNVAGFGFSPRVLETCEQIAWLRGDALYFYAALRELFGYPGFDAGIAAGDAPAAMDRRLALVVCNGSHFGGAFRIAPHARVDDGLLDAISIGRAGPLARASIFAAAISGKHLSRPGVGETRVAALRLEFAAPPVYELDGELVRAKDAVLHLTCVPGALRVVTSAS